MSVCGWELLSVTVLDAEISTSNELKADRSKAIPFTPQRSKIRNLTIWPQCRKNKIYLGAWHGQSVFKAHLKWKISQQQKCVSRLNQEANEYQWEPALGGLWRNIHSLLRSSYKRKKGNWTKNKVNFCCLAYLRLGNHYFRQNQAAEWLIKSQK